jgi:WG containing repeat
LERALKNEPLRPAQLEDKWGYIDPSGNFLIPPQFDCAEPFVDGVAIVELKKRFGYIGTDGHYLINPKYFWVGPFHEGFAWVVTEKPWFPLGHSNEYGVAVFAKATFIDKYGREIRLPFYIERFDSFFEGLAVVRPGKIFGGCSEKAGYMDTKGEWAVKPQFDEAGDFSEGLAAVNGDGKGRGLESAGTVNGVISTKTARLSSHSDMTTLVISSMVRMCNRSGTVDGDRQNGKGHLR